ncbi:tetratricopeptide repeat protein 28 isoform X2 [Hyposmocoma kahamanoa]|uniref:tetratricopeptide repeat protein 28 isoform X2 n=1 Tax=Hyposmocoma kahamanoa TaxID=1477025 RepID=UPI000E6D7C10|nr:tetratricopeptide repeat protein 28 isoform X2 [Hyposmocoma kahamanoa]
MSQRDFSEVEPTGSASLGAVSRALFVEKVRASNAACQAGDFATAVALYTDALTLDPANHILYSNRSAARLKQGQFAAALQDATRARELCPNWPKAYYRQGVALQCLGRHGEALAAFSSGLGVEPSSRQLLAALVEASLKSPLRTTLEPTFRQLEAMKLDQSPFVLISVVGQELLAAGQYQAAVTVLEAALRIGSCSLKLRGSVFSALSSAHWALNQLDAAINYMQQDLAVAKSLGDTAGECRAHGNLGAAYFSQGSYKDALTAHRYQLVLAMKCKDTQAAAAALTSLGHVYTAIGDYPNALASHKQCVQLVKQMGDRLQEAREIGNVGAVYLAMGEFDSAVDCHTQHLRLARRLGDQVEEARAYSNLGSSYHYRRNFSQAIAYHENVLRIAQNLGDRAIEARAYAGLGHAARCAGDYAQAKKWHERQLDVALAARDKIGEGRACSNLGIVYQLLGEHDAALKLHQAHLSIARQLQDKAGMGRAYGNIGNAYSAAGFYEQAIKYHKQELTISKEVHDRSSEASTHGNLAVAYQALGAHDMALFHYRAHLGIARELKDAAGEACALLNLGNCLSSRGEFAQAVPYYEQHLMLSQELGDVTAEAKACHFLGYAHYCLGNYREAVRYYDQDLSLAKDLQDKMNMGRAYCNLGLAHLALGNLETALECQKYFLAIAHMTQHLQGKFRALGNIGDVLIKMGDIEEAVKMYQRQLGFARQARDRSLEAAACGALGLARRLQRRLDAALGHHTQELTLRQEAGDSAGEARAHSHLGAVHMALGHYSHAARCYREQLERAQELQDCALEAQAYGNLGIAKLNMGHYEDAIGYLEQQLAILERVSTPTCQLDKARALGSLGDCYDALGDPDEAAKYHEQHLAAALKLNNAREQERAYRGLGLSHKSVGNLQQALVCLEKRLVVSHELGAPEAKAQAFGELGALHISLGNLEQAVSCLEHQKNIAKELNNQIMESEAYHSLGVAQHALGDFAAAVRHHRAELELAHRLGLTHLQARACGGLGAAHASMGAHAEAARWHESRLRHATAAGDTRGRAQALADLGRAHLAMGACGSAVSYLRQALAATEGLADADEEARVRHRLGFALWASGEVEEAKDQLQAALNVLETGSDKHRDRKTTALYTSTQHALQRVFVELGRHSEALVVAERGRCRSLDVVTDKQASTLNQVNLELHVALKNPSEETTKERTEPWTPSNLDQIIEVVNKQKSPVLYYSLAAGRLYAWLLQPHKGILRFHQVSLIEEAEDCDNSLPDISPDGLQTNTGSLGKLERSITEWSSWIKTAAERRGETSDDQWEPDERPTGLTRMMTRNHLLNSSNYSLSSLFSVGSVGGSVAGSVASLQGSTRSSIHGPRKKQSSWQGPPCLNALYQMLLAPFEDLLPASCNNNHASHGRRGCGGRREIVLVIEGTLYACPWGALRGSTDAEPLCERYALLAAPALRPLRHQRHLRVRPNHEHGATASSNNAEAGMRCLVVGAPRVGGSRWASVHAQLKEAELVADMLRVTPLTDYQASKEAILTQLPQAECIHFATHICWKTPAIVLSPGEVVDSQAKRLLNTSVGSGTADTSTENEEENTELPASNEELPPVSEFMLTASEITNLKITARLVVISCAPSSTALQGSSAEELEDVTTAGEGVSRLCRALLAAGAQAILLTLWPAPKDTATKILYRALYSALLQGSRVAKALGDAMQTVRHTKHFAHPAHWSGLILLGANVRLSNKVALMGQALCELLAQPDKCRDALRVCLHLVEKSLQRIVRGQKNAMYTTQKSIENKAGHVTSWRELLMSVGFRFEPAANGIPSSVFFPQSDPEERLTQCSASLQALLGLTSTTLQALSKLIANGDVADDIIGVIRSVISQFSVKNSESDTIEVAVNVRLWRVNGCHELLASLGFDLAEVGQDEVTLRTGKTANRRHIQFVLQALLALFDTQEAPRSLSLESSSSVESLASIDDGDLEPHSDGEPPPRQHRQENVSSVPPPPLPLGSCGGAFTMYVRGTSTSTEVGRGEPDGRTAPPPAPPPPRYRGESDAAFTPSPPAAPSTTAPKRDVSLALAHQTKIRTLYTRRPPSTDDSDWESSGHDTVLRRRPEHSHTRYLDAFYDLASAQPRRTEEDKTDPVLNQPSTSKRVPRPKMGTSSRDSLAQVRHMSGELTPTISEVYHERNIGLGLAPPLAELLLAEDSKTEMRTASSSENLLLQNLEKLGLLGEASESEEHWCSGSTLRPWLSAPPLGTDVQGSDLTTAEIIERQTKFKKDADPKSKEENAYELKPKEEIPGPSGTEKRSVSPFSELSRRDEGDGRSIADSHSSYKALVLSPRAPYLPEEGEAGLNVNVEGGKTHPRTRRPPVPRTRPAYTTLDFPPNK